MSGEIVNRERIRDTVRTFILTQFLADEDPGALDDLTSLIGGGLLDSIGSVRLVSHLEDHFNIVLSQADITVERLDTVKSIVSVVEGKLLATPTGESQESR